MELSVPPQIRDSCVKVLQKAQSSGLLSHEVGVDEAMDTLLKVLKPSLLLLVSWFFSMLKTSFIKYIVSDPQMQFPYPFFMTFLVHMMKAVLALLIALLGRATFYAQAGKSIGESACGQVRFWFRGFFNFRPRIGCKDFALGLLPIGLVMGVADGAGNQSLQLLSVSLKTMIQSCNSAPVLLFGWIFGLEKFSFRVQAAVLLVSGGGVLSAYANGQEGTLSYLGLELAVLQVFMDGLRVSFTQLVLQRKGKLVFSEETRDMVLAKLRSTPHAWRLKPLLDYFDCTEVSDTPRSGSGGSRSGASPMGMVPPMEKYRSLPAEHSEEYKQNKIESRENSRPLRHGNTDSMIAQQVSDLANTHGGLKVAYVSKPEILIVTAPATAAVCLVFSLIYETGALNAFLVNWRSVGARILVCSVCGLGKLVADLAVIQLTSAFVFILSHSVHDLLLISCGILFFEERPPWLSWVGFGITSSGMILYASLSVKGKAESGAR